MRLVFGSLSEKEIAALGRRRARLAAAEPSIRHAMKQVDGLVQSGHVLDHLILRNGFAYRADPGQAGATDRSLPPRDQRPPATRIVSPNGCALRFYLTAIGVAQIQGAPGRGLPRLPLRRRSNGEIGWTDLVASEAVAATAGRVVVGATEKKLRQVQSALVALERAGLVELPRRGRGGYTGFQLLNEEGRDGDPIAYRVPRPSSRTFALPGGLITRGWIHVLQDSELTLLAMVACGLGRLPGEPTVAIPGGVRLLHYGVGRDAFASHKVLSRLGLLSVEEVARHDDGRAEDYANEGASLHRLALMPGGFDVDALDVLMREL